MENLYLLAITPPEGVSQKIIKIQNDIAERFDSKAALKVIPHITLKAPFRYPAGEHETIIKWFANITVDTPVFTLELKDFDAFHNKSKPVIFINPTQNKLLFALQKQIMTYYKKSFPKASIMSLELDYHPHLTVAYRDLLPEIFQIAWQEYSGKTFSESFLVSSFHLLQHNGKQWKIIQTCNLKAV